MLIRAAVLVMVLSGCAPLVVDCDDPEASGWDPSLAELEVAMLDAVNARRAAGETCRGVAMPAVPALTTDARLTCAARSHSVDMLARQFFDHVAPGGVGPDQRATAAGYEWTFVAENIAAGRPDAETTVQDLVESTTGHCENLMSAEAVHAGMGVARAEDGADRFGTYWTQVFAAP